jgi:iron complex outermembrane receptor protein
VVLASQIEPIQPIDPFRQPIDIGAGGGPTSGSQEEISGISLASRLLRDLTQRDAPPTEDRVGRAEVLPIGPTDLGQLLQKADDVLTVNSQQRSPVAFDPHVRGYRFGQIYTESAGEYFLPVRLDLDSMLAKIDPYLMQTVTVVPGPYAVRYGPGMAFIEVVPIVTQRSDSGPQWNNRFFTMAHSNGGQIFGQDTLQLAGSNYGAIGSYGLRTGGDYSAGNGQKIPSSYHNQNEMLQLGYDVGQDGRVEMRYSRLDLWDTEYALQFFDVNSSRTDSYNINYTGLDAATGAEDSLLAWYNQTQFDGDNLRQSKREIRTRVANGLNHDFGTNLFTAGDFQGYVNGGLVSTGARAMRVYGDADAAYVRLGTDVRMVTQSTYERFHIHDPGVFLDASEEDFSTNQPHSVLIDPGMFAEWCRPWTSFLKTTAGTRVDMVNTHPRVSEYDDTPGATGFSNVAYSQNDFLLAGFLTGQIELTPEWSIRGGAGYSERVPDLVNRYADGVFLGILQNGFSKVVGRPSLKKERLTQADASLVADYGVVTSRLSGFFSWIDNYNTYTAFGVDPPTGAQILLATNTALATIGGCEWYGDCRVTEVTSVFATMQYVHGTDEAIHRPLTQIYPLQSRLGIRFADPTPQNFWGLEWGVRMVAAQNRAGWLRDSLTTTHAIQIESATPGFYTSYLRGYYNLSQQWHLTGGIDNLFNRTYLEHLNLRLPGPAVTPGGVTAVLSPGFSAYAGLEWLR